MVSEERGKVDDDTDEAAVTPVSGAVNRTCPCVDSMNGPPARINTKLGRKVNQVTVAAAKAPARNRWVPRRWPDQPPTKPTNATTMINGPGVDSPNASPSIICTGVNHANVCTAP